MKSLAYDRFDWCDGISYSYISFCAKSASITLVDFSVDFVSLKKYSQHKSKVKLEIIWADSQFISKSNKYDITILVVRNFHGNSSLVS